MDEMNVPKTTRARQIGTIAAILLLGGVGLWLTMPQERVAEPDGALTSKPYKPRTVHPERPEPPEVKPLERIAVAPAPVAPDAVVILPALAPEPAPVEIVAGIPMLSPEVERAIKELEKRRRAVSYVVPLTDAPSNSNHAADREAYLQETLSGLQTGGDTLAARTGVTGAVVAASWVDVNRNMLSKGQIIPCTLETALQSDLPGMTRCVISRPVYSDSGNTVLIPRGSIVTGEYRGGLDQGVSRVFVVWDQLRTPTGLRVNISSPGIGRQGESGLAAEVNRHFWQRFGSSMLLSIIGGLAATESEQVQYREVGAVMNRTAEIALENSIGIRPTGTVDAGRQILVMVAQDIDFEQALARD